jgi:thioredoxin 1
MMSKEFPEVSFVKVDVDKCSVVSKSLNIKSMPTFKIFNNGVEISDILGWNERKIREIISSNTTSKGK